jgi:hypothetical protein
MINVLGMKSVLFQTLIIIINLQSNQQSTKRTHSHSHSHSHSLSLSLILSVRKIKTEHVVDAYVVLENIYDALKPGGYLVLHERTWKYYVPGQKHYRLDNAWVDHPIRIKLPIMEHFMKYFDLIYYTDSTPKWVVLMFICLFVYLLIA